MLSWLVDGINLGNTNVELELRDATDKSVASHKHSFEIQEFRRPDFKAEAKMHTIDPHLIEGHAVVRGTASYFAGGALPESPGWLFMLHFILKIFFSDLDCYFF